MTAPGYTAADVAGGVVRVGITRLAGKYPFHARVLERFRPRADPAVGTMGVGMSGDQLELVFAPGFVANVSADELGGVLLHEVMHVVLGHVTADPAGFPDRVARTIAEEVTVNEFVREPLPGRPVVLAMFPNLPASESTAVRYRRLAGRVPKKWQARLAALPGSGNPSSSAGRSASGSARPATEPPRDRRASEGDDDGGGGGGERPPMSSSDGGAGPPGGIAACGSPADTSPRGTAGAEAGRQLAVQTGSGAGQRDGRGPRSSSLGPGGKAGGQVLPPVLPCPPQPGLVDSHGGWPSTPDQRETFRAGLADLITDVAADTPVPDEIAESLRACGVVPGQGKYVVRGEAAGELDWRTLLRRYVGRELRVEARYGRPPRRFPDLAGIVPGRGRAEGEVSVVAVVDTSASMTAPMLEVIAGELRHLGRHYPVHVVECDCLVRRSYRFRGLLEEVEGRGGTDFRPPLERPFLRRLRPKPAVVVVFTDGDGPAPDRPPAVPVIWCLTPGGRPPGGWGRVVEMGAGGGSSRPTGASRPRR